MKMDDKGSVVMLIKLLEISGIKSSDPSVRLSLDMFKNPDKELFRKIMSFILRSIGGFDDWLRLYSKPVLAIAVEAQFKQSVKAIIRDINQRWPDANLKTINQSLLVAPQGSNVVSFLRSLAKFMVTVLCERRGDKYERPSEQEKNDFLSRRIDDGSVERELVDRISVLSNKRDDLLLNYNLSRSLLISFIESKKHVSPTLIQILQNPNNRDDIIKKWKSETERWIGSLQNNVEEIEEMNSQLSKLKDNLDKYLALEECYLDGNEILKALGFKSNVTLKFKDLDLVRDGQLDLISYLKFCSSSLKEIDKIMASKSSLIRLSSAAESFLGKQAEVSKKMESVEVECRTDIDSYEPLVKQFCESKEADDIIASDPDIKRIWDCQNHINQTKFTPQAGKTPIPDFSLPPVDNLHTWIVGDTDNSSLKVYQGSERKCRSLRASPSLGRKFSAKKTNLFMKTSDRRNADVDNKKPVFSIPPLIGLCRENRRATLASPQMARRERLKAQHFDVQCKPLKPLSSKALFTASSPINDLTRSFFNEKISSFDDHSKVESVGECLSEIPSTSGLMSFNSPKPTELGSVPVISTPELLEWDRSSPESDLNSSPTAPGPTSPARTSSPDDDHSHNELNESAKLLIEKFKRFREDLNLSH